MEADAQFVVGRRTGGQDLALGIVQGTETGVRLTGKGDTATEDQQPFRQNRLLHDPDASPIAPLRNRTGTRPQALTGDPSS